MALNNIAPAKEFTPSPLTPTPTPNSPIRKVDFRNFTYPEPKYGYLYERVYTEKGVGAYPKRTKDTYKLVDGVVPLIVDREGLWVNTPVRLASLQYEDVTKDGEEEALITMAVGSRGTAIPTYLYVYTWEKNKPKMLFDFGAGDRADGGFRRIYASNGELIIELDAGDEEAPSCDGCQPTRFSRLRYEWNGSKFVILNSEMLPIASKVSR